MNICLASLFLFAQHLAQSTFSLYAKAKKIIKRESYFHIKSISVESSLTMSG